MIAISITLLTVFSVVNGAYLNAYDGLLDYTCPSGTQAIVRVSSIHDNGAEDRRFDLGCAEVYSGSSEMSSSCFWTDYQNAYDQLLHYSCPTNHYISGMNSVHDNGSEDRKWKFYCCAIAALHEEDCHLTGWTNDLDAEQTYTTTAGEVIKGVISIHDNGAEDRRYEYDVCKIIQESDGAVVG